MTVTLELPAELAAALHVMAEKAGMDPDRYFAQALQEHVERRRNEPPRLSREETRLLQQINRGLPAETWKRYQELVAKRRAETLTPVEHQELMALTNEVELWSAHRIELVRASAQLRNVPLTAMMRELGLTPPRDA